MKEDEKAELYKIQKQSRAEQTLEPCCIKDFIIENKNP